ncbi:MAG: hypothetical protein GTO02_07710 [Candidatus Dadabacteria bacterium]|nr:hypothetical protein [Candidatus Dadabacteria bacterium]
MNRDALLRQAAENKFRGELKPIKSRKSGKWMAIYKPGLTTLQKIGSGTGAQVRGETRNTTY